MVPIDLNYSKTRKVKKSTRTVPIDLHSAFSKRELAGTDIYYVDKVEPLAAASIAMNPRTFIAVNQTDATIYAKCSCNQLGVIDISYDYYIWDYYDWGPGQEDLYSLNTFGYVCNFLNVGQLHGDTFTFCNNK